MFSVLYLNDEFVGFYYLPVVKFHLLITWVFWGLTLLEVWVHRPQPLSCNLPP